MRPIDADALIEKCGGWYVDECTESGFIGTLKDLLATEPTIQPEKAQLSQEGATSDLISRQAAIDAVDAIGHIATMPDGDKCIRRSAVKYTLSMLPTVQPEPHEGHWIWVAGELMCPECRTIYSDLYPDYDNAVACPHCGARMKGER